MDPSLFLLMFQALVVVAIIGVFLYGRRSAPKQPRASGNR